MYWIVFARTVNQPIGGYPGQPMQPAGPPTFNMTVVPTLFRSDTAEEACQAAARKMGGMGTYFAVEGTPWGVDMIKVEGVEELGEEALTDDKERRIRALERSVLDRDDLPL